MKVLIIGFGSIGKRHSKILADFTEVERVELVTRQEIKEFKTYKRLEEVERLEDYDYFVISSETYRHYENLDYINTRVKEKTILVEKPLFHEYFDFEETNNRIFVAYNLRFHPVINKIKNKVRKEDILYSNIIAGQYLPTWRPNVDYREGYSASKIKGGGVLLDLSHEIDYIQWIMGEVELNGAINTKISDLAIDSDDLVTAIGILKPSGGIVNFTMDYISKSPIRRLIIYTNEMDIIGDLIKGEVKMISKDGHESIVTFKGYERDYSYIKMHKALITGSFEELCSLREGLMTLNRIQNIKDNFFYAR